MRGSERGFIFGITKLGPPGSLDVFLPTIATSSGYWEPIEAVCVVQPPTPNGSGAISCPIE
jgi:hypothetical protein